MKITCKITGEDKTSYLIKKWENELKSKGIKVINNKQNEKDTRI